MEAIHKDYHRTRRQGESLGSLFDAEFRAELGDEDSAASEDEAALHAYARDLTIARHVGAAHGLPVERDVARQVRGWRRGA